MILARNEIHIPLNAISSDVISGCASMLFFASCNRSSEPPPASFVQLVARADRVAVTNLYRPVYFVATGDEFAQLSTAVTNATRDRNHYDAMFDWEVAFYQGTNRLTVIHFQDRAFLATGAQFSDNSGKLKSLYEKWEKLEGQR